MGSAGRCGQPGLGLGLRPLTPLDEDPHGLLDAFVLPLSPAEELPVRRPVPGRVASYGSAPVMAVTGVPSRVMSPSMPKVPPRNPVST